MPGLSMDGADARTRLRRLLLLLLLLLLMLPVVDVSFVEFCRRRRLVSKYFASLPE